MITPKEIIGQFRENSTKISCVQIDADSGKEYSLTFREFADTIVSLSNFFYRNLKLQKGDTVSFLFENCPEILALNLSCFLSGLRTCPLDSKRDTPNLIKHKLSETQSKVLFYRKDSAFKKLLDQVSLTKIKTIAVSDFFDLIKLAKNFDKDFFENFSPTQTCLVLYTSGTTGMPKGTLLTFDNLFYGQKQVGKWFNITKEDIFYLCLPLHHINSTIFSLSTLLANGSLVISSRYSRTRFLADSSKYSATLNSIVPTINLDLLEQDPSKYKLSFKRIQIGSAPVSAKHALEFVKKYGVRLIQGYGSTETSLRATGVPVDLDDKTYLDLLEQNSIGEALSENQVEILDSSDKIVTKENTEGELGVKGKNIMEGYLGRPDETKQTLRNGYFHTGDLGYFKIFKGKKFFFLKARIKEIIIKGGVNISPLFIEEVLRKNISWAREVIVVGFPDYRFGEEVGAIFIPKDNNFRKDFQKTMDDFKKFKIKSLSRFETPKGAIVISDKEVPKTATGKIQRTKAKEIFQNKLILASKSIGQNADFTYRLVTPDETQILQKAVDIHNSAFPKGLNLTLESITHRATNGFVIASFDSKQNIVGVLTGFRAKEKLVKEGKNWQEITGNGTFNTFNPKGEIAVLTSAASITSSQKQEEISINPKLEITLQKILDYIDSDKDFVVRFHEKPKAGFKEGAKVYRVILNGNPNDIPSLKTVVMFIYPPLKALEHRFSENKIGFGLVEAAILHAKNIGCEKVIPLSRIGEAFKYIS